MNVSAEQLEALKHGEPVQVEVDDEECVLILKTAFDQMKQQVDDPRQFYSAVAKAWDETGSREDAELYAE